MSEHEYLLICLMEEAAEIQQTASKCLRFGLGNHPPNEPSKRNIIELYSEIADIKAVAEMLEERLQILYPENERIHINKKKEKMRKWMEASRDCDILKGENNE